MLSTCQKVAMHENAKSEQDCQGQTTRMNRLFSLFFPSNERDKIMQKYIQYKPNSI